MGFDWTRLTDKKWKVFLLLLLIAFISSSVVGYVRNQQLIGQMNQLKQDCAAKWGEDNYRLAICGENLLTDLCCMSSDDFDRYKAMRDEGIQITPQEFENLYGK